MFTGEKYHKEQDESQLLTTASQEITSLLEVNQLCASVTPGLPIHWNLRSEYWWAFPFSRGSSLTRGSLSLPTLQADSFS